MTHAHDFDDQNDSLPLSEKTDKEKPGDQPCNEQEKQEPKSEQEEEEKIFMVGEEVKEHQRASVEPELPSEKFEHEEYL